MAKRKKRAERSQPAFDYKADDPAFELGLSEDGGQIQNSNSVAYTLLRNIGSGIDDPAQRNGWVDRFPGWGRNLLDPNYRPYKFPVTAVEDSRLHQESSP